MAEPLKNYFGPERIEHIARELCTAWSDFPVEEFRTQAAAGFEDLELTDRCRSIAAAMVAWLPADRLKAVDIMVRSLGPELENCDPDDAGPGGEPGAENPMATFTYLPHNYFLAAVADEVEDSASGNESALFDAVMHGNYEVTKRFSSEFGIRTPLRNDPVAALQHLHEWTQDDNVHVRRLVSEGTRPRLPWSFRLKRFQEDPAPVLELLERLKDDPVEYVRRSVANNLNDIAKDHPELVVQVAKRWWADGDTDRRRLIRHALRTLVKQGDPDALAVLGFHADSPARLGLSTIEPIAPAIGSKVVVTVEIENPSAETAGALVDLQVHFVKANGSTSAKVFKGAELTVGPGQSATVRKSVSLRQHSTRIHHRGEHRVDVLINGIAHPVGSFELLPSDGEA